MVNPELKSNFKLRTPTKSILKFIIEKSGFDSENIDFTITLLQPNEHLKNVYISIYRAIFKEFDSKDTLCLKCYEKLHGTKIEDGTYLKTGNLCNEYWENTIIRFRKYI